MIGIVTGAVSLLNTVLTFWLKSKVNDNTAITKKNSEELQVVHNEVNHHMKELLEAKKSEGKLEALENKDKK